MARSAYIHIPFCRHRCGYCHFSVVAGRDHLADRFLAALDREMSGRSGPVELDTLYLGGGTPSHLTVGQLGRLGEILQRHFQLADDAEFTAECNPSDMEGAKPDALARLGVNRISLGVQSLDAGKLLRLERDHNAATVAAAVERCRTFCRSLSLDLIFAVGEESFRDWQRDVESAMELAPDHFSTYELTFEKGTPFWNRRLHGELVAADEEIRARMYEWTIDRLQSGGWEHYEISSFARPGHRSRHNSVYWSGADYLAFGPGASRYLKGVRETNHPSPVSWLKRIEAGESPVYEREQLDPWEGAIELLSIGLRRVEGVDPIEFREQTGWELRDLLGSLFDEFSAHGLWEFSPAGLRLTRAGKLVADGIAARLWQLPPKRQSGR